MTAKEMVKAETMDSAVIESLIVRGDISALSSSQKSLYYRQLCESMGLNPTTQPFKPLKLNGKEVLYADKGCAEQLRKLHNVALTIVSRERVEDIYVVTARATLPSGRTDESVGAVPIAGLKGESLANALMKAETKSKRRVTLSILGLGMLDESELDAIPRASFGQSAEITESMQQNGVAVLPPPVATPKQTEKLPEIPDRFDTVPEAMCGRVKRLQPFAGRKIAELSDEELAWLFKTFQGMLEMITDAHNRKYVAGLAQDLRLEEDRRRIEKESFDQSLPPQ